APPGMQTLPTLRERHASATCLKWQHRDSPQPLMYPLLALLLLASGLACAGSSFHRDTTDLPAQSSRTVLDLGDVTAHPTHYEWFDFRPNVKKLILAGAPETAHVAILRYTVPDGRV